jgi:hypothetical protein
MLATVEQLEGVCLHFKDFPVNFPFSSTLKTAAKGSSGRLIDPRFYQESEIFGPKRGHVRGERQRTAALAEANLHPTDTNV